MAAKKRKARSLYPRGRGANNSNYKLLIREARKALDAGDREKANGLFKQAERMFGKEKEQ